MAVIVPVLELESKTQQVISQAVVDKQDVFIEQAGRQYAVILSSARYQNLVEIAKMWARERFLNALQEVHQATAEIPIDEIEDLIAEVIQESRRDRIKVDASHS